MELKAITIAEDESFLRQISKEVNFQDKSYLEDIKVLGEYCANNEVFAMAAVQLGIPKRIIYLRNTKLEKVDDKTWNEARVLINPVIKERIGYTKYWEACASCLDNTGLVARPYKIKVEPGTQSGTVVRLRNKGLPTVNGYGGVGDLYVKFAVWIPKKLNKDEKEIVESLRSKESFKPNPTKEDKSFFDKLKDLF